MFNTILNNLFKNDNTYNSNKKSKVTKEISDYISGKLRRFYKFCFLLNKCCYCYSMCQNIFEHLFSLECHNFVKCVSNMDTIERTNAFLLKELNCHMNIHEKNIENTLNNLFSRETLKKLEDKVISENCGLKIIGLDGNNKNEYTKMILNKFHGYFKNLNIIASSLIYEIKEAVKKFI